ncbi:LiaI-LiaF-like domain-containing protein [Alkalihalobacillus trypoxylicola]|uniref:LiaF transmembrane domain-containing protein n=1 Tax=Alkalihalobacillus trypoxylicola TaxID=519424 RepID=A0A161PZH0_9BACI|nr:DUF5668 domain-containing protein [Alkalihalobacillus trypoxylicola]KYG28125.1 hypothetical protein AZF04_09485 [Alkalihalobacillus trypoxylicola]
MRTWRVGSFSMGITLILLGIVLVASNWFNVSMYDLFMSWWPFLLIIVGAEMLFYLKRKDEKEAKIKYDFLSIFFVGIIGTIALSFMFLSVSGLMEELKYTIAHQTEITYDLPTYSDELNEDYDRVVIELNGQHLNVEAVDAEAVEVFGTYQNLEEAQKLTNAEDYLQTQIKGNTLYMSLKSLPSTKGIRSYQPMVQSTVLIPQQLELEVRSTDNGGSISLHPRDLTSDWYVKHNGSIEAYVQESGNLKLEGDQFMINQEDVAGTSYQIGDGDHSIHFSTNHTVMVYTSP